MNLREIRRNKNITQHQLAELVGVGDSVISKYENGTIIPPVDKLEKIANFLKVSVDCLIGKNDPTIELETKTENQGTPQRLLSYYEILNTYEESPDKIEFQNTNALRDILLKHTNGHCELCGNPAPFIGTDGQPYLETHFIKWLSRGGTSTIDNLVVLCPNCRQKVLRLNLAKDIQKITEQAQKHIES